MYKKSLILYFLLICYISFGQSDLIENDIKYIDSIKKNFETFKPHYILHLAGLSRPMSIHDDDINKSIDINIIGTCNLVKVCNEKKKKNYFFFYKLYLSR